MLCTFWGAVNHQLLRFLTELFTLLFRLVLVAVAVHLVPGCWGGVRESLRDPGTHPEESEAGVGLGRLLCGGCAGVVVVVVAG